MSKCLKCGAPLPPVGDCPTCAAASQLAARAVPSLLDKEIQIDRRRPDRDAQAPAPVPPHMAPAAPPGMTARAVPPGMTPAGAQTPRPQAPAPAPASAAPRAPGLPVMPPRPQAPAAPMAAAPQMAPAPRAPAQMAPAPRAPAMPAAPAPRPPPAAAPSAQVTPAPAQAAAPRPPAPPPQAPSFNLPGVAAPAPRANTPSFGVPTVAAPAPAPAPIARQAPAPGLPVMPPRPQAASALPSFPPAAPAAPAPLAVALEEESFSVEVEESEPPVAAAPTRLPAIPAPAPVAAPAVVRAAPAAPGVAEVHARPASLWRRLLAFTIDTSAIAGVAALYLMLASSVAGVSTPQTGLSGLDAFVSQVRALQSVLVPGAVLLLVLSLVYCAISAFLWNGRTLGRRLLGLRLVDTHGLAPAPGRAIVRAMLASLSFGLFLAGFWMALFDRRGQTLHDKLTSTYVVQPS